MEGGKWMGECKSSYMGRGTYHSVNDPAALLSIRSTQKGQINVKVCKVRALRSRWTFACSPHGLRLTFGVSRCLTLRSGRRVE